MNAMELKQKLIEKANEIGIDKIGFTTADPFVELKQKLVQHRESGYESGFEEPDLNLRTIPTLTLPEAKSIIAIAIAYPSKMSNPPRSEPGAYRGIFARASWGQDYHDVLREKLAQLEAYLLELVPTARTQSMVDTGALSDRAVAERAGIGWSAKNTSILTEEFGSWIYLGEMITDLYLPPDDSVLDGCGDCTLCLDVCPTGALVEPGQLDSTKCIAFLTQTKGSIDEFYREKIGNRLYGCDTCQTVCPKNRKRNFTHHTEFEPDPELVKPLLQPLLTMSNREFKEKYGYMSGSWRGKKPIQRNAIIALAHFQDRSAIPLLKDLLGQDPRPVIRGMSAWALSKIGGAEIEEILNQAFDKEQDEEVLREIRLGLERIQKSATSPKTKEDYHDYSL
ncbi:tRNA epoxyqueuosine(34) reductase QueG [Baia soyae]|uniref:Epoxyqueuosine reductase n=1 Tax=Baia soyae TaxID=1544746 RepID=A0A4R2S4Q7_9BACL|nr:tRNA epoxyqueuosine(34) reductase QueG [Baia soyae]TCP67351.1 epoxyqueuosine reductase [Baia soyae]